MVVGVPSNDFNQERADNAAIKTFCETNFDIDFPLAEKVAVTGSASHPFFAGCAVSWARPPVRAGTSPNT